RIEVPASQVPRIEAEFLEDERRALGEQWFRQEYCCSFEALEGLVYPDFAKAIADSGLRIADSNTPGAMLSRPNLPSEENPPTLGRESMPPRTTTHHSPLTTHLPTGRKVGGIDFGYRNPFAAVWGVLDRDGVLWLTGEHYKRQKPLTYHAQHLPKDVRW